MTQFHLSDLNEVVLYPGFWKKYIKNDVVWFNTPYDAVWG